MDHSSIRLKLRTIQFIYLFIYLFSRDCGWSSTRLYFSFLSLFFFFFLFTLISHPFSLSSPKTSNYSSLNRSFRSRNLLLFSSFFTFLKNFLTLTRFLIVVRSFSLVYVYWLENN